MKKKILWFAFTLLFLLGCRADVAENIDEQTQFQKKKYFIKKNELSNEVVLKKLSEIQNKSNTLLKKTNRSSDKNILEGRIIIDNRILVVENSNQSKSYTFPIRNINDSTSALENLVIVPNHDSFRAFILRYKVNKEERQKIVQGQFVENIIAKTELIDVDYDQIRLPAHLTNRGGETSTSIYSYGCVKLIVTKFEAYTCQYCSDWTSWEIDTSDCEFSGGGNGGDPDGGSTGGTGGGGPGGGGTGGGTTPIEEDDPSFTAEYENTVSSFRSQLNGTQYSWFIDAENKFIGMDLASIYNQYRTPQVFNFLASLIDSVTDKPSNIIFLYQAKNYLTITGVDSKTMQIVNNLKQKVTDNSIGYDFTDCAFNFLTGNPDTTWEQFQNWFFKDTPSDFLRNIVLENPATIFDYTAISPNFKMTKLDQLKYPRFTQMVKNMKKFVDDNPIVLTALVNNTGLTADKVKEGLIWVKVLTF